MQTRICLAAGLIGLVLAAAAPAAEVAATEPAVTQPATPSVADLIHQLGDPDPTIREQANKSLWSLGRLAEPSLREAAGSDVPEISRRAKAILRDFTYGLYPDAPHEIFALLESYRNGDLPEKRIAIGNLAANGVAGLRVLMKLRDDEADPNLKQMIVQVLAPREHDVAVLMLADGQAADVERMLESAAIDSPGAAQDYAALLLLEGKIKAKSSEWKPRASVPRDAPMVVALARAAGDAATARLAAETSGAPDILDAVLLEQADWKTLASRLAADQRNPDQGERLGPLCAFYRLAGDEKSFRQTLKELMDESDGNNPKGYLSRAQNLFLNDAPKDALGVLFQHEDYLEASNFLAARLQFDEALNLPKLAEQHQPEEATQVKAKTAGTLAFLGRADDAHKLLADVVEENRLRNDYPTWGLILDAARELDQPKLADQYAAIALEKATAQDPVGTLFESLNLGDGPAALQWWQFLRQEFPKQTALECLGRLHSIFDQTISRDDLEKLAETARRYAVDLPASDRETWQETVADTLVAADRIDLAGKWIERLEDSTSTSTALIHAGDYRADRKDWAAAAADYDRAWEHDRTQAVALFLKGWAVVRGGNENEGRAMIELAHRLPLGNETGRYALYESMLSHDQGDDAQRELTLILRGTSPQSWERNEALRRTAETLTTNGDYLKATVMLEQAFQPNLTGNVSFVDPWANVVVPALINKDRALGMIKAGQMDAALAAARLTMQETPGDADALIELVTALDKSGHKQQAEALYAEQTAIYRKIIADYPTSGPLHNQLAWSQVMCHRELDDALTNGKRAVELEPTSTASIDTLAEVYFARGDAADAVKQMQRCIELEPRVERHHRQLERFSAAMGPTTKPD